MSGPPESNSLRRLLRLLGVIVPHRPEFNEVGRVTRKRQGVWEDSIDIVLLVCQDCGGLVAKQSKELHIRWHREQNGELA